MDSCSVLRNTVLNTIHISRTRQQWEEKHSPQADKSNTNKKNPCQEWFMVKTKREGCALVMRKQSIFVFL